MMFCGYHKFTVEDMMIPKNFNIFVSNSSSSIAKDSSTTSPKRQLQNNSDSSVGELTKCV